MTDSENQNGLERLIPLEKRIHAKRKEVLLEQRKIADFLDTEHRAKATKEYQKVLRALGRSAHDIAIALVEEPEMNGSHKAAVKEFYRDVMEINALVRNMERALFDDLSERRHEKDLGLIKIVTVMTTMAVGIVTLAKNTFDPKSTYGATEATIGAVFGFGVANMGAIVSGCRRASQALCAAPQKVGHSFLLFYVKETARGIGTQMVSTIKNERSFVFVVGNDDVATPQRGGDARKRKEFMEPRM